MKKEIFLFFLKLSIFVLYSSRMFIPSTVNRSMYQSVSPVMYLFYFFCFNLEYININFNPPYVDIVLVVYQEETQEVSNLVDTLDIEQ